MNCLSSHPPSQIHSKVCITCFPSTKITAKPTEINLLDIHKNLEVKQYDPYIPPNQDPENVIETEPNEIHVNPIASIAIKNLEPQSTTVNIENILILHLETYIQRKVQEKSLQDINLRKDTEILDEDFPDDGRQGQDQEAEKACPICFDAVTIGISHELTLCKHTFHLECVKEYFIEAVNYRKIPIKCPDFQCQQEVFTNDINFILEKDQTALARYQKFSREFGISINPHQYLRCVTPDCEHIWSLNPKPEHQKLTCPDCSQALCRDCKKLWHQNMSCEKAMKKREKEEDFAFLKFAAKRRFQTCPKCNYVIEKIDGCNAITCASCMTAFCYYCGSEGDGHSCKHRQKRGLRKTSCTCSIF